LQRFFLVVFCLSLSGCAMPDSQVTWLPGWAKGKPPVPSAADPIPDVKSLVRNNFATIFSGNISAVQVSAPKPNGLHWQFCARPSGLGVAGNRLQPLTYLVQVESGILGDRVLVNREHWCNGESYEPAPLK
jgi:hypothetical protein